MYFSIGVCGGWGVGWKTDLEVHGTLLYKLSHWEKSLSAGADGRLLTMNLNYLHSKVHSLSECRYQNLALNLFMT